MRKPFIITGIWGIFVALIAFIAVPSLWRTIILFVTGVAVAITSFSYASAQYIEELQTPRDNEESSR